MDFLLSTSTAASSYQSISWGHDRRELKATHRRDERDADDYSDGCPIDFQRWKVVSIDWEHSGKITIFFDDESYRTQAVKNVLDTIVTLTDTREWSLSMDGPHRMNLEIYP